jgi:hypothetical protein
VLQFWFLINNLTIIGKVIICISFSFDSFNTEINNVLILINATFLLNFHVFLTFFTEIFILRIDIIGLLENRIIYFKLIDHTIISLISIPLMEFLAHLLGEPPESKFKEQICLRIF